MPPYQSDAVTANRQENSVTNYFSVESASWDRIYHKKDLYSIIHQERRKTALAMFESLNLPHHSPILEIGCGAGLTAVDIALRGYMVEAVDSTAEMVALTGRNASKCGVESLISTRVSDIYQLPFPDHSFKLLLALGVAPWLPDLNRALQVVSRLLVPDGYLIMNVDNRHRLNHLLDPAEMPVLAGFKNWLRRLLEDSGLKKGSSIPRVTRHTPTEFENLLGSVGLETRKQRMIGFGPFTFLKIKFLPAAFEVGLHRILQRAADQGVPVFKSTAAQYLVLAQKCQPGD